MARIAALDVRTHRSIAKDVVAGIAVLVALFVLQGIVRNKNAGWSQVGHYLFDQRILRGARTTVELTFASMALALVVAVLIAVMRLAASRALRWMAIAYVWFFRSVPVLVLLILTFNIAILLPRLGLGIPFGHEVVSWKTQTLLSPFLAAVLAFAFNEAAYASEILRSSLQAVPKGQWEAATAVGMTRGKTYRKVIFPQAVRIAVPPLANDLINLAKGTALVSYIAVFDLTYTAQSIYQVNYEIVPLLIVITVWYVAIVSVLTVVQVWLERHLRGSASAATVARFTRLREGWARG